MGEHDTTKSSLLSYDEIQTIRTRARAILAFDRRKDAHALHPSAILRRAQQVARDVERLLMDLAASPPLIVIASKEASAEERGRMADELSAQHKGPVLVLPFGWKEALPEQRAALRALLSAGIQL